MLTSFKEIDHPIYLFHEHIYYIFKNIFHYDLEEYDEEKLVHPDFRTIINASKVRLLNPLKEIVKIYHKLPYGEKITVQEALVQNNCISVFESLSHNLITYEQLHSSISSKLKKYFEDLWDDYPQTVIMENQWNTVKHHYDLLTDETNCDFIICPFCGIYPFNPPAGKYREEYDHIIAKATYPFVSINFKLLFPCCQYCNKQEKRSKELLYNASSARRLSFYPYDSNITLDRLSINVSLNEAYNNQSLETLLKSIDWKFEILRNGVADIRDESWDEVYGIKRRFSENIKRLEAEWFRELIRKFKRNAKLFTEFLDETIDELKYQIPIAPMGIIKYIYFTFIFNIPDIENKLKQVVTV